MKRNTKHRTFLTGLLTLACTGILLSGCGTDKASTEIQNAGQEITEADLNPPASLSEQDTSDIPANDSTAVDKTADNEQPSATQNTPTETQDTSTDTATLYEQFLYHDLPATVGNSYPQEDYRTPVLEAGATYTLSEMSSRVSEYFLNPEYTDKTSFDYIQYAYVDCPDNPNTEQKNLLLKFVGLNIYSQDDDSYAVFVLSENAGKLSITYEYECWARSATQAFQNGILNDSGSAGAGDHYSGLSALLSDGSYTSIYNLEDLGGWWTSSVNETLYNEVFDENTEVNLIVSIYTIGNDRYYLYDMSYCSEEEIPMCETYIDRCRAESGINWSTEEEVETAIQNRCAALGIDYQLTESQKEAEWNTL